MNESFFLLFSDSFFGEKEYGIGFCVTVIYYSEEFKGVYIWKVLKVCELILGISLVCFYR